VSPVRIRSSVPFAIDRVNPALRVLGVFTGP
jgi:hypothetical protein